MRNLGAYRVDRRIRHDVYKDVPQDLLAGHPERGYHSMFFPGGTRSRSGRVEHHLKLGLLGTTLSGDGRALSPHHRWARRFRRSHIVPVTINMQLVLEAETLIADYLRETGSHASSSTMMSPRSSNAWCSLCARP